MARPFFILAPMDDVTDTVFRQIIDSLAPPDVYFTEFVNVDGLQSVGRERVIKKLWLAKNEGLKNGGKPIIAQIWGKNPENYYKTTKDIINLGFDGVDINMGCPDKAVIKNGCCSALINNRPLADQIINEVKRAAGDHYPVSVKCRVGFTTVDLSWIEFLLSKKLNMLSIHLRTVKDMSKVPARWDLMKDITELRNAISPKTQIVGNGDVTSKTQGKQLAKTYGLDGIMIGRGIFHNPMIFDESKNWADASKQYRIDLYKRHVELFASTWQDNQRPVPTLNKFCKVYIQGFLGAKELREKLMSAKSTNSLLKILSQVN